jgi:hypothetical protein
MRHAIVAALIGLSVGAPVSAQVPAQPSLKSADCSALKRRPDGTYLVARATRIVDGNDNFWDFDTAQVIGPQTVGLRGVPLWTLIGSRCG